MIAKLENGERVRYDAHWLRRKIDESYAKGGLYDREYDYLIRRLEEVEL